MADIKVKIVHPTDGRLQEINADETLTAQETLNELIANNFLPANPQGYFLSIKGGNQLQAGQTLHDAGVKDGTVLNVNPATDAGAR